MKKILLLTLVVILSVICLASCELIHSTFNVGEHTYEYIQYETGHFKQYTCGCPSPEILGLHCDNDENGECDVCGYERTAGAHAYDNACDTTCNTCGATRTVEGHKYLTSCSQFCSKCDEERPASELVHEYEDGACKNCGEPAPATEEATTTKPADTTTAAPAEEEKGCRGAINSTYAVLALVAVLGFAFVAKKREEN